MWLLPISVYFWEQTVPNVDLKCDPGLGSPVWVDAPVKLHPDTCCLSHAPVWQHLSGVVLYSPFERLSRVDVAFSTGKLDVLGFQELFCLGFSVPLNVSPNQTAGLVCGLRRERPIGYQVGFTYGPMAFCVSFWFIVLFLLSIYVCMLYLLACGGLNNLLFN